MDGPSYQRIIDIIQKVNRIAVGTRLEDLLDRALDLFLEVACAEAGTLYLYDAAGDELIFRVVRGDPDSQRLIGARLPSDQGIAGAALWSGEPLFVPDITRDPRWNRTLGELNTLRLSSVYCLPLLLHDLPIGVVQVFNLPASAVDQDDDMALLQLLANAMVGGIAQARLLEEAQRRERRMSALVDVISRLTSTLDRQDLLTLIMNHASELLDVEATSVWELDEQRGVVVPFVATGTHSEQLKGVTVRVGEGLIGECVATGQRVLVQDARDDQRHNKAIDDQTGFQTRTVLTVPLRAPSIELGAERGEIPAHTIGGAQAINKRDASAFTADEIALFEVFASQAATVLQLSQLYSDTYALMMGMIKALAGAVDARDRHNRGHSQRVSDASVAIAQELGLSREQIYHVRIGSLLHDIGKIGIPDAILDKPGRLTDEELIEMRSHTVKGYQIMSQAGLQWLLRNELPALIQHHERLDGRGYPNSIGAGEISLIGRIVAVADVFDALTSDRPYRRGWSVEETLAYLCDRAGTEFDAPCVEALCRAREKGNALTQRERPEQ